MPIQLGSNNITAMNFGTLQVDAAYLGSTQVFSTVAPNTFNMTLAPFTSSSFQFSFTVKGTAGDEIIVDNGTGANSTYTIATTGVAIAITETPAQNFTMSVTSTGTITEVVLGTSFYKTVQILKGLDLVTLDNLLSGNTEVRTMTVNSIPAVASIDSICKNCAKLTFATVNTDNNSTQIKSANAAFMGTALITTLVVTSTVAVTDFTDFLNGAAELTALTGINTTAGLLFTNFINGAVKLACIDTLNTLNSTSTTNMFLNTPLLTAPNATEQTALLSGSNYVNAGACP